VVIDLVQELLNREITPTRALRDDVLNAAPLGG